MSDEPGGVSEVDQARAREAQGDIDGAVASYHRAGLIDDVARLLFDSRRPAEAAQALLADVAARGGVVDDIARGRARRAAACLEAAGHFARAADVWTALGEQDSAALLARRLLDAGRVVEGAAVLLRLGEAQRALDVVVKVPRTDPRYRAAAVEAARAVSAGAKLSMQVDRFFTDFIQAGPEDDRQADALYGLAGAYARQGFPEHAIETLARLVEARPGFRDAALQIANLEEGTQRTLAQDFARVLEEDAVFSGADRRRREREPVPASKSPVPGPPPVSDTVQSETVEVDTSSLVQTFAPGVVLQRRYRLEELIGKGGMSIVYRASDLELGDNVALKIFTQPASGEALERFKQELRLARQLVHLNIIKLYDMGTALGARYLTMELLLGEDMHAKMSRGVSLHDGAELLAQACDGLQVAHDKGIIHRDVKPENLFVTEDGTVKVMDFGIAKVQRAPGVTVAGMVVGTPEYMAPEQAHGYATVTPLADLYSLGIMLYHMCTGHLPFRHAEMVPLLMMHVTQPPLPPHKLNPHVPKEAEALVLELLEKDPARRPQSARQLAARLRALHQSGVLRA